MQLPVGTERSNFKAYEEVTIPPSSNLGGGQMKEG